LLKIFNYDYAQVEISPEAHFLKNKELGKCFSNRTITMSVRMIHLTNVYLEIMFQVTCADPGFE